MSSSGIFLRPRVGGTFFDHAKVERLRRTLADGELVVDADAIARRLVDRGWFGMRPRR